MKVINNTLDDNFNVAQPHESLSDKYRHLPDSYFIQPLIDRGFTIDSAEGGGLGTRLIRLSHPELLIGNDKVQVVATNSHDGSKAFNMFLGIFRLVCSNGLIVGESFTAKNPVRHIGNNFYEKVDVRVDELLRETDRLVALVERMKTTTDFDVQSLVNNAFQLRFKDDPEKNKFYKPLNLLHPNRSADTSDDLWTMFNVLQEKLIRGGFFYRLDSKGTGSIRFAKGSTNINNNIRLNTKLWDIVQGMVA